MSERVEMQARLAIGKGLQHGALLCVSLLTGWQILACSKGCGRERRQESEQNVPWGEGQGAWRAAHVTQKNRHHGINKHLAPAGR